MMTIRIIIKLLLFHLSLLIFFNLFSVQSPLVAFAEDKSIARLAYGRKIHYAPQIIALELGVCTDEGARIHGQVLLAGIQCAEALFTGASDVAVMGDVPSIFALASGRQVKIVASYGGGENMHRIVVSSNSRIRLPRDLVGKRVAIQLGSSTHGAFLQFCKKKKIDILKIKLINLRPTDMPEAMATAQIDAVVGSEPWPTNVEAKVPGSYELATLSGLDNEYPLMMLVTQEFAEKYPDQIVAMLRATDKSIKLMNEEPVRAAKIISKVTGVSFQRELKVMKTLVWQLRLDKKILKSLSQTAAFLRKERKISKLPDFHNAFDIRFLNEAIPSVY